MKKNQEVKMEQRADLSALREFLPPWVPRNWKKWDFYIPYSSRTIANEDCLGNGPKNRIMIGNVVAYEKEALIEWLECRSKVIPQKKQHGHC